MAVQIAGNILVQSNGEALPISMGGTGQTTAPTAINALLPVQTGQSGKVLVTNGTNVSWSASAGGSAAGADTQIQYNDAGSFGASANFVINKSTGALTSLSTFSGTGLFVSDADATTRSLKFQTAGSNRWLLQTTNVAETGSDVGSNFEFVRVADNGATSNQVFTVARLSGVVDFKVAPTVNGSAIGGGVSSFNTRTGAVTLTSGDVTTALTFTPYDATNPSGYISSITSGNVTTALGYTPYNATNPSGYITSAGTSAACSGNAATATTAGTVTTAAQTNITSVGTLTSLAVTGSITTNSLTVGYLEVPQHLTGTTTLVLADSGKHIFTSAGGQTYTIPANSSVAYNIGTVITFVNTGASACTIAITSDTLTWIGPGTAGSRTLAQYGMASALKVAATTWVISGTNLT